MGEPPSANESPDTLAFASPLSRIFTRFPRRFAHWLIRGYQLSLSALMGRQCRHWPSCSTYTDEAIQRHGLWAGGWMGLARICRCGPGGTSGIDIVCEAIPPHAAWHRPWRYGLWRKVNAPPDFTEADRARIADILNEPGAGRL